MLQMPPLARYLMAVVLLGLAGYMVLRPKGPNAWIGVRLPWTMADREIWDKSWLLAELMLMSMGLGALFFWPLFIISVIALIVLGLLYPPFLYYRKYGTWRFWKDLGQILNPPPVEGLRMFIETMLVHKITEDEIITMVQKTPAKALGLSTD